jgi:hypothetical protein
VRRRAEGQRRQVVAETIHDLEVRTTCEVVSGDGMLRSIRRCRETKDRETDESPEPAHGEILPFEETNEERVA